MQQSLFDDREEHAALPPRDGDGPVPVRFEPSGTVIEVPRGTLLLDAARDAGLPVAQSCGGFAICSWCRMQVLEGEENLMPPDVNEKRLMLRERFRENERASCQAEVIGAVTVTTTYW